MPCEECENGKYKWGKTGECKYDSKEACEKANKKNYNKMRPTPLGKTYEQYEKEVNDYKEFNLSKVERVNLSLVGDAKAVIKKADNELGKLDEAENDFNNAVSKYEKIKDSFLKADAQTLGSVKRIKDIVKQMEAIKSQFIKAGKDLGVDYKDIKEYKNLETVLKFAISYSKSGLEQSKEIRKYLK